MNTPFSSDQTFSLSSGVIVTKIDGEAVLLNSSNGQYFGLNSTATDILKLIEKKFKFSAICEELTTKYPISINEINTDIHELLLGMLGEKLIYRCL